MAVNKALLRKTLAFIEKHPEKHDQARWCGTAQCFAGWACHLDGWRRTEDSVLINYEGLSEDDIDDDDEDDASMVHQGGTVGEVGEVAASILGLSDTQAEILFRWTNSMYDVRRIVAEFCK